MPDLEKPKRSTRKKTKKGEVLTLLNFRSAPEIADNVLFILIDGSEVEITEDLGEWLKVTFEKTTGYVMAQYVKRVD